MVTSIKKFCRAVVFAGLLVVLLFLADCYFPDYYKQLLLLLGINSILAVALNITNGFTGLFSLGHGGLMLAGGYAAAYLTLPVWWKAAHLSLPGWLTNAQAPFLAALLIGAVAAMLFGLILAMPSLRLKGHYFMLMTLGFNVIMQSLGENLVPWTNGAKGLILIPRYTNIWWVYGILAFLVIFALRLKHSKFGRMMIMVGKDQLLAEALGVNPTMVKALAFAISSFFTGLGGVLLVHYYGNLFPHAFGISTVFHVVMMIIIGGLGSITGSILGATIVTISIELLAPLQEGLTVFGYQLPRMFGLADIIFAVLLIALLAVRPQGLMGDTEIASGYLTKWGRVFLLSIGKYLRRWLKDENMRA